MEKIINLIMRVTNACNLGCRYCYVAHRSRDGVIMSHQTLGNSLKKFSDEYNRVRLIWHGGEPLLAGVDFYRRAVELQGENSGTCKFGNGMQTNLTLLDERTLDFLLENDFNLGTSLDGPEDLHNYTRPSKNGENSFQKVMQGIDLIRKKRRNIGAIAVLSKASLGRVREIYSFFKDNNINFELSPLIATRNANIKNLEITPLEYADSVIELFNLYFYDKNPNIRCDTIDSYIGDILTRKPRGCERLGSCLESFMAVDPRGDIFPCGRFNGEQEFRLGNINEDTIPSILMSDKYKRLRSRNVMSIKECNDCNIKDLCNGGCSFNAWNYRGDIMIKDIFCSAYKRIYLYIGKALKKEIEGINKKTEK